MARTRPQYMPHGKGALAAIRIAKGYTRPQLVERIRRISGRSLHVNALGALEAGRSGTTTDTLKAIAAALEEPVAVVFDALEKCRAAFRRRQRREGAAA